MHHFLQTPASWTPERAGAAIWVDTCDPSAMRQDRGGASASTPAAFGSVVGSIRNKGTVGGWWQAPADAARPTLSEVSGRPALVFGGSHVLTLPSPALAMSAWEVVLSAEELVANGFAGLFVAAPISGDDFQNASAFALTLSTNSNKEAIIAANGNYTLDLAGAALMPARVVSARRSGSSVTAALGAVENSATITMSGTQAGEAIIGGRFLSGSLSAGSRLNGRMFDVAFWNRVLTTEERAAARAFAGRRAGL